MVFPPVLTFATTSFPSSKHIDMFSMYGILHIGNKKCQTKEVTFGNEYHKELIASYQQVEWNPLSYYMPMYCNE
jgi:hypothetical protein